MDLLSIEKSKKTLGQQDPIDRLSNRLQQPVSFLSLVCINQEDQSLVFDEYRETLP